MQFASYHLEDMVLQWFQWLSKFKGPLSVHEFTKVMLRYFGHSDYDDLSKTLT